MHTLPATMNGAEDHRRGSTMMSTRSLPVDTLGRLKHWWPSQAYHCTFCTRVFRTAQALGGHMNIHRRERACVSSPGIPPASGQLVPQLLTPPSRAGLVQPSQQLQIAGFLTNHQGATPRPGSCNGGYGKLDLVVEPARVPPGSTTISDPLTWLFSQLQPPRLPPPPVSKPFHRGLAVCKSPPGVRRHVCRIHTSPLAVQSHVLYTGMMQSRTRGLVGVEYSTPEPRISHGVDHHPAPDQETCALDLELRL